MIGKGSVVSGLKLFVPLVALLVLFACTQPATTAPSSSQAQAINASVLAGITAAFSGSSGSTGTPVTLSVVKTQAPLGVPRTLVTITPYSGPGYTITGSENNVSATEEDFVLTVTFNNFTSGGVTFTSGSATLNLTLNPTSGAFIATYTGSFDIMYQGQSYMYSWNINFTYNGGVTYTFTGTFTIDGTTYNYSA